MSQIETEQYWSKPTGMLPNSRFPLLVHRDAVPGGGEGAVEGRLRTNGWFNNWRYPGIYDYHHFHSTTHECLGCARGWMEVTLFGEGGQTVRVETGDIMVLPAGVSHCMVGSSADIQMVGGYPDGRDWDDVQQAKLTEEGRRQAVKRIMMLPIPARDPALGQPMHHWIEAPSSVDAGLNDFRSGLG
ncbi:cupin [Devosia sp. RR2S18]|uniref:cupin n=1 Tax=Devosia rhizosphaerae TaxID=3049774 RepID=UPI00253FE308|nr:cupin [Devosia sp. RR2S18]WIJ23822.1 cupin [Devosia sp. RR2S18]